MTPKAKKELKKVRAQAKKNLEIRKARREAMQQMAKDFKDCLKYRVCPRCGKRLTREAKNWGFFDIFNPFKHRYWLYTCVNDKCEFEYRKAPTVQYTPGP